MRMAAILAGGQARRLGGRDKSQMLVGGRTILARQLDVLREVADRIVIVSNDPSRYANTGVPAVADVLPGTGSLGGIYTALTVATGRVLVMACDMPFLTASFLALLWDAGGQADIAVPRAEDGYHPLCACYAQACVAPLRRRLEAGTLKVVDLLNDVRVREIGPAEIAAFDPDGLLLLNVNTPGDLARAERGRLERP